MSAAAMASGVVSSVISCGLWECARLAHHAAMRAVNGKTGRHAK